MFHVFDPPKQNTIYIHHFHVWFNEYLLQEFLEWFLMFTKLLLFIEERLDSH